jgi:hypothetical protein
VKKIAQSAAQTFFCLNEDITLSVEKVPKFGIFMLYKNSPTGENSSNLVTLTSKLQFLLEKLALLGDRLTLASS